MYIYFVQIKINIHVQTKFGDFEEMMHLMFLQEKREKRFSTLLQVPQ